MHRGMETMSEEQIWYAVLAAVCTVILIAWGLAKRKKEEPLYIDVGKSTAILTMQDGTPQTVTREGACYGDRYYTLSIYILSRALDKDWVTTDSGVIYNRNQIVSYRIETVEKKLLMKD